MVLHLSRKCDHPAFSLCSRPAGGDEPFTAASREGEREREKERENKKRRGEGREREGEGEGERNGERDGEEEGARARVSPGHRAGQNSSSTDPVLH